MPASDRDVCRPPYRAGPDVPGVEAGREPTHPQDWNDSDAVCAVPTVTENNTTTSRIRRLLQRFDSWTLTVLNPRLPADTRR